MATTTTTDKPAAKPPDKPTHSASSGGAAKALALKDLVTGETVVQCADGLQGLVIGRDENHATIQVPGEEETREVKAPFKGGDLAALGKQLFDTLGSAGYRSPRWLRFMPPEGGITDDLFVWYARPDASRSAGLKIKGFPPVAMKRPMPVSKFRAAFPGLAIVPFLQHTLRLAAKVEKASKTTKAFPRTMKAGDEPTPEHYHLYPLGAMPRKTGGIR